MQSFYQQHSKHRAELINQSMSAETGFFLIKQPERKVSPITHPLRCVPVGIVATSQCMCVLEVQKLLKCEHPPPPKTITGWLLWSPCICVCVCVHLMIDLNHCLSWLSGCVRSPRCAAKSPAIHKRREQAHARMPSNEHNLESAMNHVNMSVCMFVLQSFPASARDWRFLIIVCASCHYHATLDCGRAAKWLKGQISSIWSQDKSGKAVRFKLCVANISSLNHCYVGILTTVGVSYSSCNVRVRG